MKGIAEDIKGLTEQDKRFVTERVDRLKKIVIKGLYNTLNDYMSW